jgi:hypothetical protein
MPVFKMPPSMPSHDDVCLGFLSAATEPRPAEHLLTDPTMAPARHSSSKREVSIDAQLSGSLSDQPTALVNSNGGKHGRQSIGSKTITASASPLAFCSVASGRAVTDAVRQLSSGPASAAAPNPTATLGSMCVPGTMSTDDEQSEDVDLDVDTPDENDEGNGASLTASWAGGYVLTGTHERQDTIVW